jgi:hypothetical protein
MDGMVRLQNCIEGIEMLVVVAIIWTLHLN